MLQACTHKGELFAKTWSSWELYEADTCTYICINAEVANSDKKCLPKEKQSACPWVKACNLLQHIAH